MMRNPRPILAKILKAAWDKTLRKYYDIDGSSPDINSEHALQAAFYGELRASLSSAERTKDKAKKIAGKNRIFVEPDLSVKGIIPDLIVCRNSRVIAVIELKYTPRLNEPNASFGKDLKNLAALHSMSSSGEEVLFCHQRYRGKFSKTKEIIPFSKTPLFVWAGIYSGETEKLVRVSLKKTFSSEQSDRIPLLEIHTRTNDGQRSVTTSDFSSS